MKRPPNDPCPCHSGAKYKRCCRALHSGGSPPGPVALMRSRYSAFSFGLADYVIETTDPGGSSYDSDHAAWKASVEEFAKATRFVGLEILDDGEDGDEGEVTFRAMLLQGDRDVSFTEVSRFRRVDGRWLYHSGSVSA